MIFLTFLYIGGCVLICALSYFLYFEFFSMFFMLERIISWFIEDVEKYFESVVII